MNSSNSTFGYVSYGNIVCGVSVGTYKKSLLCVPLWIDLLKMAETFGEINFAPMSSSSSYCTTATQVMSLSYSLPVVLAKSAKPPCDVRIPFQILRLASLSFEATRRYTSLYKQLVAARTSERQKHSALLCSFNHAA